MEYLHSLQEGIVEDLAEFLAQPQQNPHGQKIPKKRNRD